MEVDEKSAGDEKDICLLVLMMILFRPLFCARVIIVLNLDHMYLASKCSVYDLKSRSDSYSSPLGSLIDFLIACQNAAMLHHCHAY